MDSTKLFAGGLAMLGLNYRVEITDERRDLYWAMLAPEIRDEDFMRVVQQAIKTCRFFPTVAELLSLARPHVNHEAHAATAFDTILKLEKHDSRTGPFWNRVEVGARLGPIAEEAFVAAGGSQAFADQLGEGHLPFLRKRFVDAFVDLAEAHAAGRKLALTRGEDAHPLMLPVPVQDDAPHVAPETLDQIMSQLALHMGIDRSTGKPIQQGDAWEPPAEAAP